MDKLGYTSLVHSLVVRYSSILNRYSMKTIASLLAIVITTMSSSSNAFFNPANLSTKLTPPKPSTTSRNLYASVEEAIAEAQRWEECVWLNRVVVGIGWVDLYEVVRVATTSWIAVFVIWRWRASSSCTDLLQLTLCASNLLSLISESVPKIPTAKAAKSVSWLFFWSCIFDKWLEIKHLSSLVASFTPRWNTQPILSSHTLHLHLVSFTFNINSMGYRWRTRGSRFTQRQRRTTSTTNRYQLLSAHSISRHPLSKGRTKDGRTEQAEFAAGRGGSGGGDWTVGVC